MLTMADCKLIATMGAGVLRRWFNTSGTSVCVCALSLLYCSNAQIAM